MPVLRVKMRNSFAGYVLLVVCVKIAIAQFGGPQTNFDARRQLSPQQQTHILSDIQQHQHRFNIHQNVLSNQQQFPTQQFNRQQPVRNQFNQQAATVAQNQQFALQQQNQQLLNRPQQHFLNNQHQLLGTNDQIVPSNVPVASSLNSQPTLPSFLPQNGNRIVQHHTQTSFTPNFGNKVQPTLAPLPTNAAQTNLFNQNFQLNPSVDTILNLSQQQQAEPQLDPEKEKQRLKDLREKQAIIEKHNQFVEKQYEKALKKAQSDHLDWVREQQEQKKKLYQKLYRPTGGSNYRYSSSVPRYLFPEEIPLFNLAVQKYYEEHPTTTTTTTTTTTAPPPTTTTEASSENLKVPISIDDPETFLDSSRSELFSKIKTASEDKRASSTNNKQFAFLPTALPSTSSPRVKAIQSLDDLSQLQKQYRSQQIRKDDLLAQLRQAIGENVDEDPAKNLNSREISLGGQKVQLIKTADPSLIPGGTEEITLPNGRKVQVLKTSNPELIPGASNIKTEEITLPDGRRAELIKTTDPQLLSGGINTQEITLPDGRKAELIRTNDPKSIPGATRIEPGSSLEKLVFSTSTTSKPPDALFEELTKQGLPPGANFDLLKHDSKGGLEQVGNLPSDLPNQKKVTFVLLEEQSDGSFKVQGVKGNGKEKPEVDVDSILKRIKNGEIKLPPPIKNPAPPSPSMVPFTERDVVSSTTSSRYVSSTEPNMKDINLSHVSVFPNSYSSDNNQHSTTTTAAPTRYNSRFGSSSTLGLRSSTTPSPKVTKRPSNKLQSNRLNSSPSNDLIRQASTSSTSSQNSIYTTSQGVSSTYRPRPTSSTPSPSTVSIQQSLSPFPTLSTVSDYASPSINEDLEPVAPLAELPEVLKSNGLYAMAKFLRQSGLDTILNETGPYTIFAPTDKAFKALLIQLGGPEKAEEKFKENPRLLSGLLLHHVIPGAFKISSLQDEMTGVSLAGTQLRVNQYKMHDVEWNDVKITTINGAKVIEDKKDIDIPQGIAHAVDRVMFPLPVGDIIQTLQSDRERRFTNFLRAIFSSGLSESLQGSKTYTIFAPTDRAFSALSNEDLTRTISDRVLARELVMRHIIPGSLYTNGMRYYQIKDSLEPSSQITLSKTLTKIKVNNVPIATSNIPATNGVIHAVDDLLLN